VKTPWRATPLTSSDQTSRALWLVASVVALALAASIVGLGNGFAYDDHTIIATNATIHDPGNAWRLFAQSYWPKQSGGDAYRPLTMLLFTLEWAVGRGSPLPFHLVNILLNAATSVAVLGLASLLLPLWAAWLTAALFAVHPVHVEAVANGVGQSELLVGLFVTLACAIYVRARANGALSRRTTLSLLALYAAACLSKEHGIVLPALLVAIELLVVDDTRSTWVRLRALRGLGLGLGAIAASYLVARGLVVAQGGAAGFRAFMVFAVLDVSAVDRVLTLVSLVPEWLRLILWPARLSADYTPPYMTVAQGPALDQVPGLLLLVGIAGLGIGLRRRAPLVSLGVAWAALTLLPTINFIPLAERTLYLPSVGAMLAIGAAATGIASRVARRPVRHGLVAMCALLLVVGAARSASRTTDWYDTERIFRATVADFPDSYRGHLMLGGYAFEHQRLQEGERELQRAFSLFPHDVSSAFWLAEQYRKVGLCPQAMRYYRAIQVINPAVGNEGYARCLVNDGQYAEAIAQIRTAMQRDGDTPHLRSVLSWAQSEAAANDVKILTSVRTSAGGKTRESLQKTVALPVSVTEKRQ
jgi:hypothetical protein